MKPKFRAKSLANGEFVYGELATISDEFGNDVTFIKGIGTTKLTPIDKSTLSICLKSRNKFYLTIVDKMPKLKAWDKKRNRICEVNAIRFKHPHSFKPTVLVDEGNGAESTLEMGECVLMYPKKLKDKSIVRNIENIILDEYKINYEKYIKYNRNPNFDQRCTALQDVLFRLGIGMDIIGDIEDEIKEKYNGTFNRQSDISCGDTRRL